MPITKSAKKALKRSRFLRARNLQFKIPMKKAIKAVRKSVAQWAKKEEVASLLIAAYSKIDRAAKRNIVHHKAAARLKSRLAALIKKRLGFDPFEKTAGKKTASKGVQKSSKASTSTKKSSATSTKKSSTKKAAASKTKKAEDK